MQNTTHILITAAVFLAIGFGGGYLYHKNSTYIPTTPMEKMSHSPSSGMHSAMDDMMGALDGKNGAAFDAAFLSEMIVHHEGAVDMAKAALERAERKEIKDMATAIIEAQTKEIVQMKQWQVEWGMGQ